MLSSTGLRNNALVISRKTVCGIVKGPAVTSGPASTRPRLYLHGAASRRGLAQRPAAAQGNRKSPYVYPELIQIYRAPTAQTGANGIGRVVTIVLFVASIPLVANIYKNPDASNLWIPGVLVGASIPMTLTVLLCGPWTMAIQLNLPSRARRSAEELRHFTSRLPTNSALAIQFLRWAPWPSTRQVLFSDLRRLPPSRVRMSNLEHMPSLVAAKLQKESRLGAWIVRRYMGQFWVVMDDERGGQGVVKDVWKQIWEQIPVMGEEMHEGSAEVLSSGEEEILVTSDETIEADNMAPNGPGQTPQIDVQSAPPPISPARRSRRPPPPPLQSLGRKRR